MILNNDFNGAFHKNDKAIYGQRNRNQQSTSPQRCSSAANSNWRSSSPNEFQTEVNSERNSEPHLLVVNLCECARKTCYAANRVANPDDVSYSKFRNTTQGRERSFTLKTSRWRFDSTFSMQSIVALYSFLPILLHQRVLC